MWGHDAGQDRVLPVVADVGDPVGPAHHLTLGRGRRRARPAVVGDPVQGLGTQVEGSERDRRPPRRVVEPAAHVGVERILAGMPARPVPAVVPQGDGLGERHIQAARPCDGRGDLGHLERVGEPRALVILGEDEDLGLAGQPAERCGVQNAVAITFEAGPPGIGLFWFGPVTGVRGARRSGCQQRVLERLAFRPPPRCAPLGRSRREPTPEQARCGRVSPRGRGARARRSPPWSLPNGHCAPSSRMWAGPCMSSSLPRRSNVEVAAEPSDGS